jgi:hypothetical protein
LFKNYSKIGVRRDIESATNTVIREIIILNPSYVLGSDNSIREKEISKIRILIPDSLFFTIPKNRERESIEVVKKPIIIIHDTPIPRLIIETASYLAEITFCPELTIPI